MKKVIQLFLIGGVIAFTTSCDEVKSYLGETDNQQSTNRLSNQDVIAGLKEALNVGIKNAVDVTSVTDGFLKNSQIKLPFPESAERVKEKGFRMGVKGSS